MPGSSLTRAVCLSPVWLAALLLAGGVGCSCDDSHTVTADAARPDMGPDLPLTPDVKPAPDRGDLGPGPRWDWGAMPDLNLAACRDMGPEPTMPDAATPLSVKPKVAWTTSVSSNYYNSVAAPNGTMVFSGNGLRQVQQDGTLGWRVSLPMSACVSRPTTIVRDIVVFGSDLGQVHGLYTNGTAAYSVKLDGPFAEVAYYVGRPLLESGDRFYVGAADGKLYALNHRGIIQWRRPLPGLPGNPVMDRTGVIYVPLDYKVAALDRTGNVRWLCAVPDGMWGSSILPTGRGGLVFSASSARQQWLMELDPACGRQRWRTSVGQYLQGLVIGPGNGIYVGQIEYKTETARVLAFSARGKARWSVTIKPSTFPNNHLDIGRVGPIGADHTLYVFVRNTGAVAGSTAVSHLRAYSLSGVLKWRLDLPDVNRIGDPLLFDDGKLVFSVRFRRKNGSEDHAVMAIQTPSPGLARGGWPRNSHDNLNSNRLSAKQP